MNMQSTPPPKTKDDRPLKVNHGATEYTKIPKDLEQDLGTGEGSPNEMDLVPCAHCGRKFRPDRLEKHQNICEAAHEGSARRGQFVVHSPTKTQQTSRSHK